MLAERRVAMEVIRALAGHVDIRTTQLYIDVSDERKAEGIAALEQTRLRSRHSTGRRRW